MLQPHTQLVFVILQNTITGIPDHIQVIAYPEIHVSPRLVFFGFSPKPPGANKTAQGSRGVGTVQSLYRIDCLVTVGASTSGNVLILDASRTIGVKSFSMVTSRRNESERTCADRKNGKPI